MSAIAANFAFGVGTASVRNVVMSCLCPYLFSLFLPLPVSLSSRPPIISSLDVLSSALPYLYHTSCLLNSLSSVLPSIHNLSHPVVNTKYHRLLCLPAGESPPGNEETLSIFFWATGITTCPQNCPVSLGCSGFHADGLDKVTNICSKHPWCTGRSMI
jgi:hypothetical protein